MAEASLPRSLPAQVAGATTDTVTNCNDAGAGSLRDAVASASPGDTVDFSVGCSTITLTTGVIELTEDLTIDGPGASTLAVSGDSASTVFLVKSAADVSISGLTIEDGSDFGTQPGQDLVASGGIFVDQGQLTLTNSTVANNMSPNGAGIYNNDGTVHVSDSTVTGNECFAYGDLSDHDNGCGIYNGSEAALTVDNSTVTDNGGDGYGGSGGNIDNAGGVTSVTDSTVSDGYGDHNGGGISNDTGGKLFLTASAVTDNAADNGGGILNNASVTSIVNSTVASNSEELGPGGGGIANEGSPGSVTIQNSTIADNGTGDDVGNDIDNEGASPSPVTLLATIVAEGPFGLTGDNCAGSITDNGYNLDDDASCGFSAVGSLSSTPSGLDTSGLASNGGPTQTIALTGGSAAVAHVADSADCQPTDQRGVTRDVPCSIGAYEFTFPRFLNVYLINPFYWIWPDPPFSPGNYEELGTLGQLLSDGGPGLLSLFGCQLGTDGNYLSVDQSGNCEASSHPGAVVTNLGVAGYLYQSPPTDGTQTAPLYRCVGDNAPSYTSTDYLETTTPPVTVDGQQRCGEDPTDFAYDSMLGYILPSSPGQGVPEAPTALALPVVALALVAAAMLIVRRRRQAGPASS